MKTRATELFGVEHPVVQTGMGWVSGPELTSATADAGGLGIIASASMTYEELVAAIAETKRRTTKPFGVNLRADAPDAAQRIDLMAREGVKVASFALAPKQDLIKRCKDHGLVVMPSIGARRHAEALTVLERITAGAPLEHPLDMAWRAAVGVNPHFSRDRRAWVTRAAGTPVERVLGMGTGLFRDPENEWVRGRLCRRCGGC